MEPVRWSYRVVTFKNPEINGIQGTLTDFGVAGWELVSLTTTVKTWVNMTGNDLVAVFKRPASEPPDTEHEPRGTDADTAGWL